MGGGVLGIFAWMSGIFSPAQLFSSGEGESSLGTLLCCIPIFGGMIAILYYGYKKYICGPDGGPTDFENNEGQDPQQLVKPEADTEPTPQPPKDPATRHGDEDSSAKRILRAKAQAEALTLQPPSVVQGSSHSVNENAASPAAPALGSGGGNVDQGPAPGSQWKCSACTFLNNPGEEKCSMCDTAKGSDQI